MVLGVLVPIVGLLVVSALSVYLQPKFIVSLLAKSYPEVVFFVNTTELIIALTIDDVPTRGDTPLILDILRENNVKATFFCIGYNIIHEDPDRQILNRMQEEGHELGNHMSFDTPSYQLDDKEFTKQLLEVDALLEEIRNTTHPPSSSYHQDPNATSSDRKWFRPGHGFFTRKMIDEVQKYGYTTALGDVYPHDPAISISSVNSYYVINRVHPGAIIILHNRPWTIDTLRTTLPKLKSMGFTFATLSEILKYDTTPRTIPLAINE